MRTMTGMQAFRMADDLAVNVTPYEAVENGVSWDYVLTSPSYIITAGTVTVPVGASAEQVARIIYLTDVHYWGAR